MNLRTSIIEFNSTYWKDYIGNEIFTNLNFEADSIWYIKMIMNQNWESNCKFDFNTKTKDLYIYSNRNIIGDKIKIFYLDRIQDRDDKINQILYENNLC